MAKNYFRQFLFSVFKIDDTVHFGDNFFVHFSVYQTRIFHSKRVIIIVFLTGFEKQFIFNNLYSVVEG